MMFDDFKQIVESKAPRTVQNRLVTPDEATAVLNNYSRLTDPHRSKFMDMPIDNIIEFSLMSKTPNGGFKNYINEVEKKTEKPPVNEQLDYLDQPIQRIEPKPIETPVVETVAVRKVKAVPTQDKLLTRLVERIEKLTDIKNQPIVVETTEAHVERLFEIEKSMIETLNVLTEQITKQSSDTRSDLTEVLDVHKTMLLQVNETQRQICTTQTQIVTALSLLAEKVNALVQITPVVNPIVNIPAPIVNVTTEGRRVTKTIERDDNGLIKSIVTEGQEEDA